MFGLDARIALAIFGALSVISGAALYSAIQQSKVTSWIVEMKEIGKAWEQYYLDTGIILSRLSVDNTNDEFYIYKSADLIINPSISGWKGPYLSYSLFGSALDINNIGNTYLMLLNGETLGNTVDWKAQKCTAGKKCFVWVHVDNIKDINFVKKIDIDIDGQEGADTGIFRWVDRTALNGTYAIFLKYAPVKNPNG
tara:strand:- start:310 stop:897 length:588 start_codon:yes stop_codon:yes gene_type:complete